MARDAFVQAAFDAVCKDAKVAEGHYVVLMERSSYYGGPEEGGWWGEDHSIVAYQFFATKEKAEAAKAAVEKLASDLSSQAQRSFGETCQREVSWLEARGLDADFLPEPDGPSKFYVMVSEGLPEESRGCRHYE